MPAAAGGQPPSRDSAVGSGHVLQTDFSGGAVAGPNGEDPVGSLTLSGFLDFTTTTTCLNVSGNAVVGGGRITSGEDAGKGFMSSSVDHGPPVGGRPVDVTIYSGVLPRPPRNCPSPGDPPPVQLRPAGGGRFTSGDLTVVDAKERLPAAAAAARIEFVRLAHPRPPLIQTPSGPSLRVRVCGGHGMALLRFRQRTSPPGRNGPIWVRGSWQDERRHDGRCRTHLATSPFGSATVGRHRVTVRARTSGRRWSRPVTTVVDLG